MSISTFCENSMSLVNVLRKLNNETSPENFQAELMEILKARGLDEVLAHLVQG
ncbi:MAG: hypothetical protein V3S69_03915 [Dehalococcoidales bacterium]